MSPPAPPNTPGEGPWRRRRPMLIAAAAGVTAVAVVSILLLTGDGGPAATPGGTPVPRTSIQVAPATCGRGWNRPTSGQQIFDLHNTSNSAAEVYLTDARTGAIYAEVEDLAPGTERTMRVRLGNGLYVFKCLPDDADAVTGPIIKVSGGRGGGSGPAVVPVNQHDLIPVSLSYQRWIGQRLAELADQTGSLRAAVRQGDLTKARTDWLTAHLLYERMGAAYGTFGDADGAINGTATKLPKGVSSPEFTGFHRLEQGLWHGQSAMALRPFADRLAHDVQALRHDWSQARMDPADLGLRAHEILENTIQFELTGRTDYGSGSNLATARANLEGTRVLLRFLDHLLKSRYPRLPQLRSWLDRTQRTLDQFHRHGRWTPLDGLDRAQRAQVNADVSELVERLAPVAVILDVRRTV